MRFKNEIWVNISVVISVVHKPLRKQFV